MQGSYPASRSHSDFQLGLDFTNKGANASEVAVSNPNNWQLRKMA